MINDEERDRQILSYIVAYQQAYPGLSPSYREIARAVKLRSTSTVHYHLARLQEQGKIEKIDDQGARHGVALTNTVMITRSDAIRLGLDWTQLQTLKQYGRERLARRNDGR